MSGGVTPHWNPGAYHLLFNLCERVISPQSKNEKNENKNMKHNCKSSSAPPPASILAFSIRPKTQPIQNRIDPVTPDNARTTRGQTG